MNVEIGTETPIFLFCEYLFQIFGILSLQCVSLTANERPVRIQYKCPVPSYVFLEMKLLCPKQNYNLLSPSSHTLICERFIYFQDRSAYSAAGKHVARSWKYINGSQTHECGNWEWGCAIPRKGIRKRNFVCSADLVLNDVSQGLKQLIGPVSLLPAHNLTRLHLHSHVTHVRCVTIGKG